MEGDQIGHGQDGMDHERGDWLFLMGAADILIQDSVDYYRSSFYNSVINLSFSFTVTDPNHTVIDNESSCTLTMSLLKLGSAVTKLSRTLTMSNGVTPNTVSIHGNATPSQSSELA